MSYENLKKQSVEPLVLLDLQYDAMDKFISDFEDTLPGEFHFAKNLELDKSIKWSGNSSLKFDVGYDDIIIHSFDDESGFITHGDVSNLTRDENNYTQGSRCLKYNKTGSTTWGGIKYSISGQYLADWKKLGIVALNIYFPNETTAQYFNRFSLQFQKDNSNWVGFNSKSTNVHAGWNVMIFDLATAPDTSGGSLNANESLEYLLFELHTNTATDSITGFSLDAFRIYNGPDCYIEETIEDFSDYTEWTPDVTYTAVVSEDTVNVRNGSSSVKFQKTITSTDIVMATKTITSKDFTKSQILKVSFYAEESDVAKLRCVRLRLAKTNGKNNIFRFEALKAGWNTAYINLATPSQSTGGFYSYEGLNDVISINIALRTFNATDTLSGITMDSILLPGDSANDVDLPIGLFLRPENLSAVGSAANGTQVADDTIINSRQALQFDSNSTNVYAGFNTSTAFNSTNSNQVELRYNQLMAFDFKIDASDISKIKNVYVIDGVSSASFKQFNYLGGVADYSIKSGWNTVYFNTNCKHYVDRALSSITFGVQKNNATDILTGVEFANLRTVKINNRFQGKTENSSLKEWNYSSGRWKPLYWDFANEDDFLSASDLMNIELNAINFKAGNTIRINNTSSEVWSMYQEKTNNQLGIPSAPADLLIYPNTDGYVELSALVYCENTAAVRLKYRTSDMSGGTYLYSSRNSIVNEWEKLSVKFKMDSYTDTIDYIGIEVISESGNVDICEPKLVPYRFGNKPDCFVINRFDDTREFYRDESDTSKTNACTKISTIEINHYNKYGITFSKDSSEKEAWISFDWHGTLKKHQRILLDVFIKDSATLTKIIDTFELYMSRDVDSSNDHNNSLILKKDKNNHNIRIGWNTLAWTVDQLTQDDSSIGTYKYGATTPRSFKLRVDTQNASDTFAEGDIIYSNLRTFDGEPYKEILQPTESSTPASGFNEWSTEKIFSGDGSWKFDSSTLGLNLTQIPVYMDLSDTEHIYFALYSDDWSNVTSGTTYLSLKTGSTEQFYLQPDFTLLVDGEWNLLKMKLSCGDRKDSGMVEEMYESHIVDLPKLSRIIQIDLRFYLTASTQTVIYFGGIFSDNFHELPYLNFTETGNYTVTSTGDTFTRRTDGGYNSQIYLEAYKSTSSSEFAWQIDDTKLSLSFRDMKKLYQPIYIPSAAHSQITEIRLILAKDKTTTASGMYQSSVDISDIVADKWQLLEFDLSAENDISQYCDLMNIQKIYGRINTSTSTASLSGIKMGAIMCECDKVFQGGIVSEFNDSLTNSNYIGFKLYVPDEETLANIDSVNLISSVNYDYSDSRFYKKDNTNFVVGWNDVKFHIENDIEFDSKKTTTEDTNLIKNFKVYVKSANGFELNGIQIDRFATYAEDADEVLRTSKIDIVGTENGKYWEGRLLKAGKITRKISEREGLVELPSSSFELADTDEKIAGIYSNLAGPSNFLKNEVNIRIGTEEDAESEFLQLSKTYISNIEFNKKKCTIKATDTLEPYLVDLPTELYLQEDFSNIDDGNNSKPASIIYGEVESNIGALPIINLGEYDTDTSAPYVLYGVAGHACKNGTGAVYHDKVPIDPSDSDFGYEFDYSYVVNNKTFCLIKVPMVLQVDESEPSGDNDEWKNPWEEDITNIDSGGNDVEVSVAPEKIAINIHGKTIDGSPYSNLMEDVTDCIYDLLTVHMGVPSSRINTTNFQNIQTLLTQNTQLMAGAIVESENAEETIADMLISHNIQMYPDKDGKISLYLFKAQKYDTDSTLFTDEIDILANSFKCSTGVDNLINRIRYRCNFNYSNQYKDDNNSWEYNNLVSDEDSISRVGSIIDWEDDYLELKWLRDSSRADAIANRLLLRYKNGRPSATFSLPLEAFDKDLAERIRVTHYDGVSISKDKSNTVGWDAHLCNITDIEMDLDEYKLKVTVDNIQDLATNCAFLGDRDGDTVPAFTTLWADATESERTYLYLADRDGVSVTPGKMSDDSTDGKSLC